MKVPFRTMSKTESVARKIHSIAIKAPGSTAPEWDDGLNETNKWACLAVARWHLREISKAKEEP